jgi:Spy/CpxP family protein refolding chaperone
MNYRMFLTGALAWVATSVLALTAVAQTPSDTAAAKPLPQATTPAAVVMPECLKELTLTQQQQDQIQQIIREYDADLTSVWKQFGDRYLETIRTEALLLAAIEDNLTEPQRQQVRAQRRKTAQHQKTLVGTDDKPNLSTAKATSAVEEEIAIVGVSLICGFAINGVR